LLTQDLESPSGLGRYYPLCKNLAKQGFEVEIAALHSNFKSLEVTQFVREGVNISYVAQMHIKKLHHQTRYFNVFQLLWFSLSATWMLLLFVLKNPSDTILIGKPHPMNSIAGLIGGRCRGSRIILDCDDYEAASNYFSSSWQQWVIRVFENSVPKLVDHITTNTYFNKDRMIGLGISPDKIDYLPNGIDQERFQNLDPLIESQIKQDLDLKGKKVIAYIGSLNLANHPVDLLIRAFRAIKDEEESAFLLIVGGGKDLDVLKALVEEQGVGEHTYFAGRVPPDLVPYYYKVAHVSVDPVHDNDAAKGRCPLKMFESWAMGTPFITADVGDRRYLAGEFSGYTLAKPGDHLSLAHSAVTILQDVNLIFKLTDFYRKKVKDYFWNTITSNCLHIFSTKKI